MKSAAFTETTSLALGTEIEANCGSNVYKLEDAEVKDIKTIS